MNISYGHPETHGRRRAMLKTAMGAEIAAALNDSAVIEVMVNPDGVSASGPAGEGRIDTGAKLGSAEVERIIRLVASHIRLEVHAENPIVSAELPESGERFEGLLPPVSVAPCFSIRKPAARIYTLDDYVADRILLPPQADVLKDAIAARKNILIAGGTSSGKTTLANALLAEIATRDERVIILEDTRELQCAAPDCVALRTKPGIVSLSMLVRSTLRLAARPHHCRRGARARSARHAESLEHGPSRRHRDGPCQFGALGALPARTAHTGSRVRHSAPPDRRRHRSGRLHRRARDHAPRRDHRGDRPSRSPTAITPSAMSCRSSFRPHEGDINARRRSSPCRFQSRFRAFRRLDVRRHRLMPPAPTCPGNSRLQQMLDSMQGPVAKIVAVLIIIVTGLTLAFGETAGGFRRLIQIVFGISIAFAASSFFLSFFSFGGGALV